KPYGNPPRFSYLRQRESSAGAQTAQAQADAPSRPVRGGAHQSLAFEHLHDRRSVHAPNAAQETCALEQFHILAAVQAVATGGPLRTRQSQTLPRSDYRRGHADLASHVAYL